MNECDLNEDIHQYPIIPKANDSDLIEKVYIDEVFQKDMAVVSCHYNWVGFSTPSRNLHRFIRQMKVEEIPLYGIELSLTDDFQTSGIVGWKQIKVSKENLCFQKEACINLAVKDLVPEQYTKIAWIDHDIIFTNKNWYRDTSRKLNDFKVLQLFEYGIDTDQSGRENSKLPGYCFIGGPKNNQNDKAVTGRAWAARRELWKHGGLYPFCPLGGGDTAFLFAIYQREQIPDMFKVGRTQESIKPDYFDWRKNIFEYVDGSVSYIKGDVIHEWHGNKIHREYINRQKIFSQISHQKIRFNDDEIIDISGLNQKIYNQIYTYFSNRREDGGYYPIDNKIEKPAYKYDYCVIITTYNRNESLKLLLNDIKDNIGDKKVLVTVFDDGGNERFEIENYDIKYIKYVKNNGKHGFWKIINDTFKYVKNIDAKYFFYLQDDNRLAKNFFETSVKLYNKIDSSKKISLATVVYECQRNKPKWTNVKPIEFNEYYKTQWCELYFVVEKKFFEALDYTIHPIEETRWKKNPLLGSGVGEQISKRLLEKGYNMYQVKRSLASHGDHLSQMNPEDRKKVKLISII